ncbi:hypothetical protein DSO57_1027792 [Entomophthora muscae]|uniref:Uncharacterized protein n=1 Tax=Entomophthora muscae TaxID=34485 RepID=A0ACC2T1Y6_9FUNG|nr:hypothetical protein DSO57_1027792 [Entomophthora muscae]
MASPSEFFPLELFQNESTIFEFLQLWHGGLPLPEDRTKVLEDLIEEGLVLLKKAPPSTNQVSEVTVQGNKIPLSTAEKGIVPLMAKTCQLDLVYTHVMFKKFVVAWDSDPAWRELLVKPHSAINKDAVQDIANKFVQFVQKEKFSLLPLLTCITLAHDDLSSPLQKPSHHLFTKFCTSSLGDDLLASLGNLTCRESDLSPLILSFLLSLVGVKAPLSAQFKLRFAEWYFDQTRCACAHFTLNTPRGRALMDALFLDILELDLLDYQCDLAQDTLHWTLTSPETTQTILELALKVQASDKNIIILKALSLLSSSLLDTFEEAPLDLSVSLYTFLKTPAISISNSATQTLESSVSETLNSRLKVYSWSDTLTKINAIHLKHAKRPFATFLVAVAVLDQSSILGSIPDYLSCVASVYRDDDVLCLRLWESQPRSSQRSFLDFVQASYPADSVLLPFLLKNISAGCAPHVVQYLILLPSLTVPDLNRDAQAVRSLRTPDGKCLVETIAPTSIELPLFLDGMVTLFTVPKSTRGRVIPSLTKSGSICWSSECNVWEMFFKIFAELALKPPDAQSILLAQPILELLSEIAAVQPHLFETSLISSEDFVKRLIALAQTEMPKDWEFKPLVFLLLAALLPLHARIITVAFQGWFSSQSFVTAKRTTFPRIFSLCSSFCVTQHMLGVFGYINLAPLGKEALHYALQEFRSFFGASDTGRLFSPLLTHDFTEQPALSEAEPCLKIISSLVRLAQSPSAPTWLIEFLAQELSRGNNTYIYAHLFLRAINIAGPHLPSAVELMANFLLLKQTLEKDSRFGQFDFVPALLEHSNPQAPWVLVSLFGMVRPGADPQLAYSAAKAIGLLATAAESANVNCLAGCIPENHALYGAGILQLLRTPSTTLALQKRLWYLLAVLCTSQQAFTTQLFPDATALADLVLQRIADWDALGCKPSVASFLAAVWKSQWRAPVLKPLLSPKVWELLDRHLRCGTLDLENCAASVHLVELVGHELAQTTNEGWDSSFFKVTKAMTDPQVVAPVFLGGLLPSPKPLGLDELFSKFTNPQAYILPLQGTLLGDLCSNDSGLFYDLSASSADLAPQLATYMAAADSGLYKDQIVGKLLIAWQRTTLLLFKRTETHWADRGGSYAEALAVLIQGLIRSVEPIARQKQRISSPGSLGFGSFLGSLLAHAVKHPQPELAVFIANSCEVLILCTRWSFRQQVICAQQHHLVFAQANAWFQVIGRSMQLLAQENTSCDLKLVFGMLEGELHILLEGGFSEDRQLRYELLSVLLESLLIVLDVPRPLFRLKERRTAVCLADLLLREKLPPILGYQVVMMLLRAASLSISFLDALPKGKLLESFPLLFPLPILSEDSSISGNGLLYFTHAAFLRLASLFKDHTLSQNYLTGLSNLVCATITGAHITPPQMCLLRNATLLLTTVNNLPLYDNVLAALPGLICRLLGDNGVETIASAGDLMQIAQEHLDDKSHLPVEFWEGELVFCALGCLQRMDHSGDLTLALKVNVTNEASFGLLIGVVKVYFDSDHPLAERILRAALDLLTSQLLLLLGANSLKPLLRRHISYDIQQELLPYQPHQMTDELSSSWLCLTSLLTNPDFITPY